MAFIHSDRFPLKILINRDKTMAICDCGFDHKDLAKACGFRWDPVKRKWTMPFSQFRQAYPAISGRLGLCEIVGQEVMNDQAAPQPVYPAHPRLFGALESMKLQPFPFQVDGINFALTNRYAIIGSEMGLGKTVQGLGVLAAFQAPSLVVCPAFLKLNWVAEVERFLGWPSHVLATTGKRARAAAAEALERGERCVFIVNPEIMDRFPEYFARCRHWIVDEAHMFKNPEAGRTETFTTLVTTDKPETLTLMTGTALTNSVTDFYSLLKLVELGRCHTKRILDNHKISSWLRFAEHFTFPREGKFGTKYVGFRRWPELRWYLAHKYLRHSVQDHLKDLPSLNRRRFPINPPRGWSELDPGMAAALAKMRGEETTEEVAITSAKRGAATLKAPATADLVGSLVDQGEQVVVFSDHVEPCRIIAKAIGGFATVITGDTPMAERQRIVDDFQAGDVRVIVATIGAASVGITLTAARYCVFNDLPWIPASYLQAEKRFHRIGQSRACQVLIVSAPGLDTMIARLVLTKALDLTSVLSSGQEQHLDF